MAKDKGKGKNKAKPDAKAEKEAEREYKFGVEDIADELGIKPASVRVQLRNKGIEKAGKSYGWNSKSELKEVIDQIKSGGDDDKPAKKSKDKKADKSSKKSKKSKKDDDDE